MPKKSDGFVRDGAYEKSLNELNRIFIDSASLEVYKNGKIVGYVNDDNKIILFAREERAKRKSI